ncbi:hypothetical protein UA74_16055 [Actinoalloteichus fjordicus]|uniref:Uncharacterized protein n=1 Tax=Actinoalloteichus fjordicus TaxID=1612552 RepID=A0AAC9PS84_9PSEU|nr:hypothetical protein UA74_16055 [Actinoalloteichus fjordicus]
MSTAQTAQARRDTESTGTTSATDNENHSVPLFGTMMAAAIDPDYEGHRIRSDRSASQPSPGARRQEPCFLCVDKGPFEVQGQTVVQCRLMRVHQVTLAARVVWVSRVRARCSVGIGSALVR